MGRREAKLDASSEQLLRDLLEEHAKLITFYGALPEAFTSFEARVATLQEMETKLMASFDDLVSSVKSNSAVVKSAIELIDGLAGRIAACGGNADKVAELVTDLERSRGELADAVAKNTVAEAEEQAPPTEPTPEPAPVVEPTPDPVPFIPPDPAGSSEPNP